MGLGRIASDGYGTNLPLVILLGATAADITVFRLVILLDATAADITVITTETSWLHSSSSEEQLEKLSESF